MPIANYPFVQQGGKPRATLPVILENPDNGSKYPTWALIDTGADGIVVPGFIATHLGHNIDHESVKKAGCAGVGGPAETFFHSFRMSVLKIGKNGNVSNNNVAIKIHRREFAVSKDLHVMLLGVSDFLVKYVLSIDYPRQIFSIKSP